MSPTRGSSAKQILLRSHGAASAAAYLAQVLEALREATESRVCWWRDGALQLVAVTAGGEAAADETVEAVLEDGGRLAMAGRVGGYGSAERDAIDSLSRPAWLQYQAMLALEALGMQREEAPMAALAHSLRQPLSTIETAAFYIGMVVPEEETKVHEQLQLIVDEVERAGDVLTRACKQ